MTDNQSTTPPVRVEQVDCNAAADLIEAYFHDETMLKLAQDFRSGHHFGPWPQAFAAHRQSGIDAGLARGAEIARNCISNSTHAYGLAGDEKAAYIATALLAARTERGEDNPNGR